MAIHSIRERKAPARDVVRRINRAGGYNIFGQPNFRVCWGWNRFTPLTAMWEDTGRLETRMVPKYTEFDRWHLEKWMPPDSYGTPEQWAELATEHEGGVTYLMSPYPSAGDYEHSLTIQGPDQEYLPLTPGIVDHIIRAINFSRAYVHANKAKAKQALYDREARRERDWNTFADGYLDNFLPAFNGRKRLFVPGLRDVLKFSNQKGVLCQQ